MKRIVLVFVVAVFYHFSFAQTAYEQGEKAFITNEYSFAINYYKNAFEEFNIEDEVRAEIAYKIGLCYTKISKSEDAQLWLEKSISLRFDNPIVYLLAGDANKMNENYDKAIELYQKHLRTVGKSKTAEQGIESCRLAKTWAKNPSQYIVTNLAFINSNTIDYSPFFTGDGVKNTIYFSSSRKEALGDKVHGGSGESFSDVFYSTEDAKGSWSYPTPIKNINSEHEEGTPSLTGDFKEMYFTRCEYRENRASMCNIFNSVRSEKTWERATLVDIAKSRKDTANYAHPSISKDNLTLYFASDRPGGHGGFDIWQCTRLTPTEDWGKPKNMGPIINTAGDDLFPYIREDNILFFASNGHLGLGGLDLFRVNKDAKGRLYVLNLLPPINSAGDDYSITYRNNGKEEGFFSSNRQKGSMGIDDIYHFGLPTIKYTVSGKVINLISEKPIAKANVRLIGSDGTAIDVFTNDAGEYSFDLKPQTNYVVLAIHDGFLNSKHKITTHGITDNKDFNVNIYMNQMDLAIEIPNVMYDVNRWELRPESVVALEKLLDILKDNPHIIIELSSHTDHRIGRMSNDELSQLRAQSVVNYLITKGIKPTRLVAKGYGASKPRTIDLYYSDLYNYLPIGTTLTPEFISKLPQSQQNTCYQLNRRTEFRVIAVDF